MRERERERDVDVVKHTTTTKRIYKKKNTIKNLKKTRKIQSNTCINFKNQ